MSRTMTRKEKASLEAFGFRTDKISRAKRRKLKLDRKRRGYK